MEHKYKMNISISPKDAYAILSGARDIALEKYNMRIGLHSFDEKTEKDPVSISIRHNKGGIPRLQIKYNEEKDYRYIIIIPASKIGKAIEKGFKKAEFDIFSSSAEEITDICYQAVAKAIYKSYDDIVEIFRKKKGEEEITDILCDKVYKCVYKKALKIKEEKNKDTEEEEDRDEI